MANLIITKFVQEGLDAYKAELTTAISELDKMSKSEQSLNSELKKTSTSVKENTSTVAENTNTNNKNTESIKAVSRAEKDLKTAQDILNQSTDGLTKKQIELREKISSVGGIIQKNSGTVRENTAFNKNLEVQLKSLIAEYGKENKAIGDSVVKQQSIRSEIRQTTQELARKLANDEINIATIYETTKGTAQLKDAMGDANKIISTLGSDTFGLDATLSVVQSVSAGFQVLQGVTALVGSEDKDLQKILVQLNATMAIAQGLQQVQNALQKENAGRLGISIVAQKAYTIAVGESTGAVRIFRLAMLSIGIGAIIAGIILLVQNWSKLKDAITGTTDAMREQERLSRLNSEIRKEASDSIKSEVASIYELVAIAKNENVSRQDRQKAIDELQSKYPEYLKNINLETIGTDATNKAIQAQIELLTQREQIKKLADKRADLSNQLIDTETIDKQFSSYEKAKKFLAEMLSGKNEDGSRDDAGNPDLQKVLTTARSRVKNEIQKQIDDVDVLFKQILDKIGQSNKSVLEGSKKTIEKAVKDTKVKISEPIEIPIKKITFKIPDEATRNVFDELQKQLDTATEALTTEFSINPNSESLEPLSARVRDLQKQLYIAKKRYDDLVNPKPIDILGGFIPQLEPDNGEKDFKKLTLAERIFGTVEQNDERIAELQSRIQDGLKVTEELTRIGSDIANVASQAISIRYKNEANALEESKNKGLISEKKYQQELAKIKNEEAKKQRAFDIAMAVAKVPLVVLQALSTAPNPIAGAVLAAIAGGLALAQVAILASAPLPKFKTGGLTDRIFKGSGYVTGKSHENGGVNANLEGNEFVVQGTAVNKYGVNVFDKLNKGLLNPDIFALPRLDYSGINKQKSSIIINDYSKLEKLMDENNDLLYKIVNKEPIVVKTQKINDGIYR